MFGRSMKSTNWRVQPSSIFKPFISLFTGSKQKSFFRGPTFFQPIRALWLLFKLLWSVG